MLDGACSLTLAAGIRSNGASLDEDNLDMKLLFR